MNRAPRRRPNGDRRTGDWIPEPLKSLNEKWLKKVSELRRLPDGLQNGPTGKALVHIARGLCPRMRSADPFERSGFIIFMAQKTKARAMIFNRVRAAERSRLLFGLESIGKLFSGMLSAPHWRDSLIIDQISASPKHALQDHYFADHINMKAQEGDEEFFRRLGIALQKARRRKPAPSLNKIVARWWTHPHWPLWMMTDHDAVRVLKYLFGLSVSATAYSKVVERHCLVRFGTPAPIARVDFDSSKGQPKLTFRDDIFSNQDETEAETLRKSFLG